MNTNSYIYLLPVPSAQALKEHKYPRLDGTF